MLSGCSCQSRVDDSRSVNKKLTVPLGNATAPPFPEKHVTDASTAAHFHRILAVSHCGHTGARRGTVGEKYDCEWDYEPRPYLRYGPRLRVMDAVKLGWSQSDVQAMAEQWGSGGADRYSTLLREASDSAARTAREAAGLLPDAGADADTKLAASEAIFQSLDRGYPEFQQLLSRDRGIGVFLNQHAAVDKPDLFRRTVAGARDTRDAVNEHMGLLSRAFHSATGMMTSAAANVANAKVEETLTNFYELSSNNVGELVRGGARRGVLGDPEPPGEGAATA